MPISSPSSTIRAQAPHPENGSSRRGPLGVDLAKAWKDISDSTKRWRTCWAMAIMELKRRYRRTVIGPFWATLSQALFIGVMGFLFSSLWKIEVASYLPFLASGLISWALIATIITDGASCFIAAEPLVKQTRFPYVFFSYLVVIRNFLVYGHHFIVYVIVAFLFPVPVNKYSLLVFPAFVLVSITGAWLAILMGMLCARYRDVQQLVSSILQLSMFVTPVFWPPEQLGKRYSLLVDGNILYHYITLIRAPLLGTAPPMLSWYVVIGTTLGGGLITFLIFARLRRKIIFWI